MEIEKRQVREGILDQDACSSGGQILSGVSRAEGKDLVARVAQLQAEQMHMLKNDSVQVEKIAKYQAYSTKLQDNLATTQSEVKKANDLTKDLESQLLKLKSTNDLLKTQSLQSLQDLQTSEANVKKVQQELETTLKLLQDSQKLVDNHKELKDQEFAQLNKHITEQEQMISKLNEMIES